MADISCTRVGFKDKVVLVTGGAAGIGAGVVRILLSENARHVAFLDIAEREGFALETELAQKFGALRAKFIKCDISDDDQLSDAYKQVINKYHRLDIVINNAAILSADEYNFKRMIDVNFTATVNSTLQALEVMKADSGCGGIIVNLSSLLALEHQSQLPVYCATKTAVLQFSNSIGEEQRLSKSGIRVVTVCLGPTDTAILQRDTLKNFETNHKQLISRVSERQRVTSAAAGIVEVINKGDTGSTWMVANDKPAVEISNIVKEGYKVHCEGVSKILAK